MGATARLEVRLRPEVKARIEHAAELVRVSVSDFVRSAAEEQADRVLAEHASQTGVPAEFFDALLDAFDAEPRPNTRARGGGCPGAHPAAAVMAACTGPGTNRPRCRRPAHRPDFRLDPLAGRAGTP